MSSAVTPVCILAADDDTTVGLLRQATLPANEYAAIVVKNVNTDLAQFYAQHYLHHRQIHQLDVFCSAPALTPTDFLASCAVHITNNSIPYLR